MKLLCCGDLHMGRRSSRVPEDIDGPAFACAAAFDSLVEVALRERVELVLLAGDVVDRANRYFEAFGPLERGLARLASAGIVTCAVAGNHDFDVLPHLVRTVAPERFHLLGEGGKWERRTLTLASGSTVHVDGWSFPREHVTTCPLDDYAFEDAGDAPVIGLLHADVVSSESRYAPTPIERLRDTPVTAWIVGHVHRPELRREPGGACVLVPGSVQAIHPREPGVHGPWLMDIDRSRSEIVRAGQIAVSTVRYETIDVDLSGVDDVPGLESRVITALRNRRDLIVEEGNATSVQYVSCTLLLRGRTAMYRNVDAEIRRALDDLELNHDGFTLRVDRIFSEARPAVDLNDLARGKDPAAILAQYLLRLEQNVQFEQKTPEETNGVDGVSALRTLLDDASCTAQALHRSKPYQGIAEDEEPDEQRVRDLLLSQGYRLLDALVAQKEPA